MINYLFSGINKQIGFNKTQSRYYGQIILTDYETCKNEKGIFTPITNNCSHKEHNYHFSTYDYGTCDLR